MRRTSQGLGFFLPFRVLPGLKGLFRDPGRVRHQGKSKVLGWEVRERAAVREIQILDVAASAVFRASVRTGCIHHRESTGVMDACSHGTDVNRPVRRKTAQLPQNVPKIVNGAL